MLATVAANPIAALAAAVDELAAESIDASSTHALGDDLIELQRQCDRLAAQFVRRLQRFHAGHGAPAENSPTTISWLRATCGLTAAAAADRLRVARALVELPAVEASFQAGRSPYANVCLVGHLVDAVGGEAARSIEPTLVGSAEKLDAGRMYQVTRHAQHTLDPDGALGAENRTYQRRSLTCDRVFDAYYIRGMLDAEGGAIVEAALEAMSRPRASGEDRAGSQRRADALVDMASAMLRGDDLPSVHGHRPHVVVTSGLDGLRGVRGAVPAELSGVGAIPTETARRISCDASVRIAVQSSADGGDPSVSVGRASRSIPAAMRASIALRDNGCPFAGCDRPAAWTDIHHIRHWADGGDTDVANLVSLCRFHHRVVHEGRGELQLE